MERPSSFSAWLLRIAENNLRDAIRELERDKRRPPGARRAFASLDDSSVALVDRIIAPITTSSGKASPRGIEAGGIGRCGMPPDYEQVIRLYELDELSGPEVAERMNRSHGAVRMMLGRARARLVGFDSGEVHLLRPDPFHIAT
ncbi:MAG: sigma factor-like helix-turn-helix DNA-binding protein [Planctomycetota bacterium]